VPIRPPAAAQEPAGMEPPRAEAASALVPEVESLLGQVAARANRDKRRRPGAKKGKAAKPNQGVARNGQPTGAAAGGPPDPHDWAARPVGEQEPEMPSVAKNPRTTD
jgi:hypothetical protein